MLLSGSVVGGLGDGLGFGGDEGAAVVVTVITLGDLFEAVTVVTTIALVVAELLLAGDVDVDMDAESKAGEVVDVI